MLSKSDLLLLALASGGKSEYTPVQVQKLLFLIDENVGKRLNGPFFDFKPYDYGPFDSSIYDILRDFETQGLVESSTTYRGWKKHSLTDAGVAAAESLPAIEEPIKNYIKEVSQFVRDLSFADLVSAVYKAYPDMKVNSVFRGA